MDAIEAKAQRALDFIGTTNKVVSNAAKDIRAKVNENIVSRKIMQDKRTKVPLDSKHDCVTSEEEMHKHKRIICNAYTSATLIHTTPNETDDAPWHDEVVKLHPSTAAPINMITELIVEVLGRAQVNEPLIDGTYLYGVGIDMDWDTLWQYRSAHAQAAMAFLQDHCFEQNGKNGHFVFPMHPELDLTVLNAWIISYGPLYLQRTLTEFRKLTERHNMDKSRATNMTQELLIKWVRAAVHAIQEGWKHAEKGVNAFRIDHNWNKPTDGQSHQGREYGRTEPLQYPEYPPPRGQTHAHG